MHNGNQGVAVTGTGERKLRRLYYLAGRFITQQITDRELKEVLEMTGGEDEEDAQTFVVLTSTGYLASFFQGMGIDVKLPELYGK